MGRGTARQRSPERGPAFERYLLAEAVAAELLVARARLVLAAALVTALIPYVLIEGQPPVLAGPFGVFPLTFFAYALAVERTTRRFYRTALSYVTTATDILGVTLWAIVAGVVSDSMTNAPKGVLVFMYFAIAAVAGLRLSPRIAAFAAILSALGYLAQLVPIIVLRPDLLAQATFEDWTGPTVSVPRVVSVAVFILLIGLVPGQAARQARHALERSLHTVTFLFADLRGFTHFVETHGDAAGAELVRDYRALMRSEVARAGGREMKTEGDSFLAEFSTAQQALTCAVGVLRQADRRDGGRPERHLSVGIGVHAGEPVRQEGDYIGSAVNVAARLGQAAAGGELLVSDVVRGLVRTSGLVTTDERKGLILKGIADPPIVYAARSLHAATDQDG